MSHLQNPREVGPFQARCKMIVLRFLAVNCVILLLGLSAVVLFDLLTNPGEAGESVERSNTTSSNTSNASNSSWMEDLLNNLPGEKMLSQGNLTFLCLQGVVVDGSCLESCPPGYVPRESQEGLAMGIKLRVCSNTISTDFSTIQQPFLVATSPRFGDTKVPVTSSIILEFNRPMQKGFHGATIHLVSTNSSIVIPVAAATFVNNSVILTPSQILEPGTGYHVHVEAFAFMDLSANANLDVSLSFTTAQAVELRTVLMNVTVSGLSYEKLMANPTKANEVQMMLAQQVAHFAEVAADEVRVTLKPGSVIGQSTILNSGQPKSNTSSLLENVLSTLQLLDIADFADGRSLQVQTSEPEEVTVVVGVPEVLSVANTTSNPSALDLLALDETFEIRFSEPVQNRTFPLLSSLFGQVPARVVSVTGNSVLVQLPGPLMKPATEYELLIPSGPGFGIDVALIDAI